MQTEAPKVTPNQGDQEKTADSQEKIPETSAETPPRRYPKRPSSKNRPK